MIIPASLVSSEFEWIIMRHECINTTTHFVRGCNYTKNYKQKYHKESLLNKDKSIKVTKRGAVVSTYLRLKISTRKMTARTHSSWQWTLTDLKAPGSSKCVEGRWQDLRSQRMQGYVHGEGSGRVSWYVCLHSRALFNTIVTNTKQIDTNRHQISSCHWRIVQCDRLPPLWLPCCRF